MSARKIGLIFAFIVGMTLLYFTIHQFASPLLPESHGWEVIASKFDADVVRVPAGEFVMGSDSGVAMNDRNIRSISTRSRSIATK